LRPDQSGDTEIIGIKVAGGRYGIGA